MSSLIVKKIPLAKLIPIICVLDILLFPYIRVLSCSISMILVFGWSLLHLKNILHYRFIEIFIVVLMIISHILGYLLYGSFGKISISVIIIFSLFFLCYLKVEGIEIQVSKILIFYLFIAFLFALIYVISPSDYFLIRSFWTMSGNVIEFSSRTINRYTFIFSFCYYQYYKNKTKSNNTRNTKCCYNTYTSSYNTKKHYR